MAYTEITLDRNSHNLDLDVITDPDHVAKYKFFLWQKVGDSWIEIKDKIHPKGSNTTDPSDHDVTLSPTDLEGLVLTLKANITGLVTEPQNLNLRLVVQEYQSSPDTDFVIREFPINYNEPVPQGEVITGKENYIFKLT